MKKKYFLLLALVLALFSSNVFAQRQMEKLNRGVVAFRTSTSQVYVGWRMFGTDPSNIAFNVYRGTAKLNSAPITASTNYTDNISSNGTYTVRPVINGVEQASSESAAVWAAAYKTFPVRMLGGAWSKYEINDVSVGDLDGDGAMELVVHRTPAALTNSFAYAETSILEAYRMNGTFMWAIDLGVNINYPVEVSFIVYDLDGDGKAEISVRTSEGTIDGTGVKIGDVNGDGITNYRPQSPGYINSGPEFLSVFSGTNGKELARTNYIARGDLNQWGDNWGHRANKFLMAAAYVDGVRPSIIMCRGYYERSKLEAWNFRNGTMSRVWTFDSIDWPGYAGQGNHNLSIADVDNDGKDEILYGAMAVDDNGRGLYTTGLRHGDAMHVSDFNPARPGMESFNIHEPVHDAGAELHDARTGTILWKKPSSGTDEGPGRGLMLDMDPRYAGAESFAAGGGVSGVWDINGNKISDNAPFPCFAVWWDADPLRELLNGTKLDKWDWQWNGGAGTTTRLLTIYNYANAKEINGTKATPCFSGDFLGDWREELIYRSSDNQNIVIFTTPHVASNRFYTFLHDPQYRLALAWQNNTYNQPPHTSFFVGNGMAAPPVPNIYLAGAAAPISGTFRITARHSGKVLEVAANSTADGGNVQQWAYNSTNNKKWTISDAGSGYYKITNLNSGKALEIGGNSAADGGNAQQWTWAGTNSQQWTIRDIGGGYYNIINRHSGKALDISQALTTDGANVQQWTLTGNGGTNQQFSLTPASSVSGQAEVHDEQGGFQAVEGKAAGLAIYPNPSSNVFNIKLAGKFTYSITDQLGRVAENGKGENEAKAGGSLIAGVYFITIKNDEAAQTIKVIKH